MKKIFARGKKRYGLVFALLLLCAISGAEGWRELKGEHFIVYFDKDENLAKEVLYKSEAYYKNIALDLGYARHKDFWLWDKRVKIYIYPDHASYLKSTGQPSWSHGMASYNDKSISGHEKSAEFVNSVLPHEIAHLVFRDFVGISSNLPLWLDEGVAQWAEEYRRPQFRAAIKDLYESDSVLTINDMMKLDIRLLKKDQLFIRPTITTDGESGVVFLSLDKLISTYYLEGAGLVSFLIEKFGSNRFAGFCRELRDGASLDKALKSVYYDYIKDTNDLERKWREYIKAM